MLSIAWAAMSLGKGHSCRAYRKGSRIGDNLKCVEWVHWWVMCHARLCQQGVWVYLWWRSMSVCAAGWFGALMICVCEKIKITKEVGKKYVDGGKAVMGGDSFANWRLNFFYFLRGGQCWGCHCWWCWGFKFRKWTNYQKLAKGDKATLGMYLNILQDCTKIGSFMQSYKRMPQKGPFNSV